ncbi:MAG TPA: pyrroloquinoline quinone biosynthesis protein PqqB [Streptosporangiaceae bacterium]|nr:pyrroloquinoline quinone biosynthesis protein PqqB [Streptosporangiaceae bacterium]
MLGSAAGGGFPQWNCTCPPCRAVRDGSRPARPRSQSSVAVSADRKQWFLLNASPDVQAQIEGFPALHPRRELGEERQVPLRAVLLTDAELDHTLGLLLLREGRGLDVYATEAVHEVLCHGTGLLRVLGAYCRVRWHPVDPGAGGEVPLGGGLSYRAFDVPTAKRARFGPQDAAGRVVGYRFRQDGAQGATLVFLPCLPELTASIRAELDGCAALLVDGTCWQDDELIRLGLAGKTARDMGHLPISGPGGSLAELAPLPIGRTIYTHINNTNPILLEDSAERRTLAGHGFEVAADGLELQI